MIETLKNFNKTRAQFEAVFGDTIGGIFGWLVVLIPSYFSAHHIHGVLGVPALFSLLFGVLIGALEFAILARFFDLYQYRQSGKAQKGSVSPLIPVVTFVFYLLVVLLTNGVLAFFDAITGGDKTTLSFAMLELATRVDERPYVISILVPALVQSVIVFLLSLLSIPGAVIAAIGLQQQAFMAEREKKLAEKQENKSTLPTTKQQLLQMLLEDKKALQDIDGLAKNLGIMPQTVRNYASELHRLGYFKKTPNDIVFDVKLELE